MISGLGQSGFSPSRWATTRFKSILTDFSYPRYSAPDYIPNNCSAFECRGEIANFISIQSYNSLTKSELIKLRRGYNPEALDDLFQNEEYSKITTVFLHHFILSLKPSSADQIESALSMLTPLEKGRCYSFKQLHNILFRNGRLITCISTWHFLTGIKSAPQLNEMIKQQLSNYFTFPSEQ